jgi:integrase
VVEEAMRKRGKYWQARPKAGDQLGKWRSTRCTDHKAAQAVLADWERELAEPGYAAAKSVSLVQAADRVNRDYRELVRVGKKAQATADYYEEKMAVLVFVFGEHARLSDVAQAAMVDRYVERRRAKEVSEHTIHKELGVLRVVLKRAKREGWWAGDVDAVLPHRFATGAKPRSAVVPSWKALGLLLRALPSNDVAAQAAFAICAGVEAQALRRARREDLTEEYVAVHGKKRAHRERVVPIVTDWQRSLLRFTLANAEGQDGLLFRCTEWGLRNGLRKSCRASGLPHLSPNDLRRTFNVWMQRDGVPTELRAPAMGHSSTRLLDSFTYGKLAPAQLRDRMLNAVAVCQPAVTDSGGRGRTEPDNSTTRSSEVAPRAGFEPATHGLTVRALFGSYHSTTGCVMRASVNAV